MTYQLLSFQKSIIFDLAGDVSIDDETGNYKLVGDDGRSPDSGDGLCIIGAGLGKRQLLMSLLQIYADCRGLVFLLNCTPQEAESLKKSLLDMNDTANAKSSDIAERFQIVENSVSAKERQKMYLSGGIFAVTSRILIVDILRKRVPFDLITGIIVDDAHRVTEASIEAFILRKYREANQKGFIKAFSSFPGPFCHGFNGLEKALKQLRLRRVMLWPRFHVDVQKELESDARFSIDVVELRVPLSLRMRQIHDGLVACVEDTLREFKQSSSAASTAASEATVEDALLRSFDIQMHEQLDPLWNRIGVRTRTALSDLRDLRHLLEYLVSYDPVAFFSHLDALLEASSKAMSESIQQTQASLWLLSDAAQTVFEAARTRVYVPRTKESTRVTSSDIVPHLEVPPKWRALTGVLDEIRADSAYVNRAVLVVFASRKICNQLCAYYKSHLSKDKSADPLSKALLRYIDFKKGLRDVHLSIENSSASLSERQQEKGSSHSFASGAPMYKRRRVRGGSSGASSSTRALTSASVSLESLKETDAVPSYIPSAEPSADESRVMQLDASTVIHFAALDTSGAGDHDCFLDLLHDVNPSSVVMYDQNMAFVRCLEVFNVQRNGDIPIRAYSLYYSNSFEEQTYLAAVRREKDNFERLIREKSIIAVPIDSDGRVLPDLETEFWKNVGQSVRAGGDTSAVPGTVIVDLREFRSSLPSLCDKKGLTIVAVTLEVGDYVLSPDICVERKSISDLISSLKSGRLYNQMEQMSLHYKLPVLLIEFDPDRPFSLLLGGSIKQDISLVDIQTKLVLLALAFPAMRIIWSSSPHATADIFFDLKSDREEPNEQDAAAMGVNMLLDENDMLALYHPTLYDLLLALPGVHMQNIRTILNNFDNLKDLSCASEEQLKQLVGIESGIKLYKFINFRVKS